MPALDELELAYRAAHAAAVFQGAFDEWLRDYVGRPTPRYVARSLTDRVGEEDVQRQSLNVFRMKLLGAEVRTVTSGSRTLKDAINEAIRDWVTNVADTHYLIGSAVGPHPYPTMVRDFQSIIGREARAQMLAAEGRLPDV